MTQLANGSEVEIVEDGLLRIIELINRVALNFELNLYQRNYCSLSHIGLSFAL